MKNLIILNFWGQFRPEAVVWQNKLMKSLICVGLLSLIYICFLLLELLFFFLNHWGFSVHAPVLFNWFQRKHNTCWCWPHATSACCRFGCVVTLGKQPPATILRMTLILNCHCFCVLLCRKHFPSNMALLWCPLHYSVYEIDPAPLGSSDIPFWSPHLVFQLRKPPAFVFTAA